jgi:hypothetical protein
VGGGELAQAPGQVVKGMVGAGVVEVKVVSSVNWIWEVVGDCSAVAPDLRCRCRGWVRLGSNAGRKLLGVWLWYQM